MAKPASKLTAVRAAARRRRTAQAKLEEASRALALAIEEARDEHKGDEIAEAAGLTRQRVYRIAETWAPDGAGR